MSKLKVPPPDSNIFSLNGGLLTDAMYSFHFNVFIIINI